MPYPYRCIRRAAPLCARVIPYMGLRGYSSAISASRRLIQKSEFAILRSEWIMKVPYKQKILNPYRFRVISWSWYSVSNRGLHPYQSCFYDLSSFIQNRQALINKEFRDILLDPVTSECVWVAVTVAVLCNIIQYNIVTLLIQVPWHIGQ